MGTCCGYERITAWITEMAFGTYYSNRADKNRVYEHLASDLHAT
jgi:hypothetical protein